ncbi:MAG: metal-dependent hydrolase [Aigarchaeota archaeon]|nr:metal-dependent hydrolase [Aigarchaeota archaeon]MDW8092977.1 metal-dependent hydrolase [Nitrososphaerota archaeon]
MARLQWLGHAAWKIEIDGKSVVIDPFLSNNPVAAVKPNQIGKVDAVIVTHEHGDHVGDSFEICRNSDATFIALYELATKASQNGVKKTVGCNIGGPFNVDGIRLAFTPAIHTGNASGVVILGNEATIYHTGDTSVFGDMKLIGQLYRPDIALVPIGSFYTMGPQEASVAVSLIKPKIVIPMHFNTFEVIKQDPEEFSKMVKKRAVGVKVVILRPGETFEYSRKKKA